MKIKSRKKEKNIVNEEVTTEVLTMKIKQNVSESKLFCRHTVRGEDYTL